MRKLLLGGSPCTHWSIAQTRNRETQPEGLGWELFRNYLIAKERFRPDFFLYENNKSMAPAIRTQITAELGVEPILINSALVSAQSRQRLYWTNIPGIEQPEDMGILLRDILETGPPMSEKGYSLLSTSGRKTTEPVHTVPAEVLNINPSGHGMNGAVIHTNGKSRTLTTNKGEGPKIIEPVWVGPIESDHFPAPTAVEPVNITADGKAQCLRATYYKDGIRNMVGNIIDRKTCVAEAVRINRLGGFYGQCIRWGIYDVAGKAPTLTASAGMGGGHIPMYPIRVGTIESGTGSVGQGHRVYSVDGKSKTLCGNGGGAGAKTGLYTIPTDCPALREKASCLSTSCQHYQYCGTLDKPIYEVRDGQITVKGHQYPINLMDGYYIIRKLTVLECMRLQTVPEDFVFPVSNSQAYKMLGNGWTVDVIAHILSHCPGITTEPLEVLSMYDGMSCGHLALDKLGANIVRYYATEIDKYAIKTTQTNFPDTIQLGDAFQVREDEWWSFFVH